MSKLENKHFGYIFFLTTILITYLPFFIYTPIPGISNDSFEYFYISEQINLGQIPIINLPIDIPVGYSIFLYFMKIISNQLLLIEIVQLCVFILSCVSLIHSGKYLHKNGEWIVAIALSIFAIQPYSINYILAIGLDGVFCTFIFFLISNTIKYYYTSKIQYFIWINFFVAILILIRSNGLLFLGIPIWILISFKVFSNKSYLFFTVIFLLMNSMINFKVKGYFMFTDINRFRQVLVEKDEQFKNSQVHSKQDMMFNYATNFFHEKPSFYFSLLPSKLNKFNEYYNTPDSLILTFLRDKSIKDYSPTLKNYIFKENNINDNFHELLNYGNSKNKILMLFPHYVHSIIEKTKINYVIYLFFLFFFTYELYKELKSKQFLTKNLFIIFSMLFWGSVVLLPFFNPRFQPRYIYPLEIIINIFTLLFILNIKSLVKR